MADCYYDFRLNVRKRVTDGHDVASTYAADFWTATLTRLEIGWGAVTLAASSSGQEQGREGFRAKAITF